MGVSAAVAAIAVSSYTAYEAKEERKSAAKKEKEARKVSQAEQAAQQTAQTRQQIREERVRRAQILQQSQNTGVGASSGALGSTGALQTSLGSNLAAASRQANSANAITNLQQQAADYRTSATEIQATGQLVSSVLGAAGTGYDAFKAANTPPTPTKVGGQSPATQPNPYDINNLFR